MSSPGSRNYRTDSNGVPITVAAIPLSDPNATGTGEPTIGNLVRDATTQVSALVRAEVELARAEVIRDVKKGVAGSIFFIAALVVQAIVAFVILKASHTVEGDELVAHLKAQVSKEISPIAKPREIHVVPELPKTRSGKIMRRLLRDVAEGRELGDTSTLVDPSVFEAIRASK
ncbi:Acetyl-CoA synthetase [Mycobacteroides abscessus]|nr:Acetyl-CoA synthetase [Mycobacteroides abscessus]